MIAATNEMVHTNVKYGHVDYTTA